MLGYAPKPWSTYTYVKQRLVMPDGSIRWGARRIPFRKMMHLCDSDTRAVATP